MSGRLRLFHGALALELAPEVGGAVSAYTMDGRPLMRPTPEGSVRVLEHASFPLVPYSNRVRDGRFSFRGRTVELPQNFAPERHPLHGLGWQAPWTVREAVDRAAVLDFSWPGGVWPWPFRAAQRFVLDDAGLSISVTVENTGDEAMPAGLGLHPYYPCPPGTVLDAAVSEVWTVDADLFPDGRAAATGRYDLSGRSIHHADLDNGFGGWDGEATIRWPDGRGLRIRSQTSFFQVYAPKDADVLVAEPVSHANGALNAPEEAWSDLGLRVLQPGRSFTLSARFDPI